MPSQMPPQSQDDLYIYVVTSAGVGCKIGVSQKPAKRLAGLRTGSPFPLTLSKTFRVPKTAAYPIEASIHRDLTARRISGEWFSISETEAETAVSLSINCFFAEDQAAPYQAIGVLKDIVFPNDPLYIHKWRLRCKFTQEQAAKALGCSLSRFCVLDRGEARARRTTLLATLTVERWGAVPDGLPLDSILPYYNFLSEKDAA